MVPEAGGVRQQPQPCSSPSPELAAARGACAAERAALLRDPLPTSWEATAVLCTSEWYRPCLSLLCKAL